MTIANPEQTCDAVGSQRESAERNTSATALGRWLPEPGRSLRCYLRVAQTYMLISMPTGTSTIFGAFQAIDVSQVFYK